MQDKLSFVYILTNHTNHVLYTGSTGRNLKDRIWEHKHKALEGFTKKYNVTKLVYFEIFGDLYLALEREKQIKAGSRLKKIKLIKTINPSWRDLYDDLD